MTDQPPIVVPIDSTIFECVLPKSGRFARMHKIRWIDVLCIKQHEYAQAELLSMCATLDGQRLTGQQWVEMEYADIGPLLVNLRRRIDEINAVKPDLRK